MGDEPEASRSRSAMPGRDRGIAHEGGTFAMYNKFKGDDDDDKLFVKGHKNWLHGVNPGSAPSTAVGYHPRATPQRPS